MRDIHIEIITHMKEVLDGSMFEYYRELMIKFYSILDEYSPIFYHKKRMQCVEILGILQEIEHMKTFKTNDEINQIINERISNGYYK